jgi:V/A-type H+-transporting ATPase subunit I
VEIIDYTDNEDGFAIGRPDPKAEEISKKVIMLRTLIKELGLEDIETGPIAKPDVLKDMGAKLATIHAEVSETLDERERLDAELKFIEQRTKDLVPFAALGLDLGSYRGLKSVRVLVGSIGRDFSQEIGKTSKDSYANYAKTGDKKTYICAFVPSDEADAVSKLLLSAGFQEISVPSGEGDPSRIILELMSRSEALKKRMDEVERKISDLREKHKDTILATEEILSAEIERFEAPLRFATSKNAFIADIWIPGKCFEGVKQVVGTASDGRAMCIPVKKGDNEDEPIVMDNPRILSPFEGMVKLFSTPKYHEIDPTVIMSIFYPIFFGLMVSDVGFGIVLAIIGVMFIKGRTLGLESMASKSALKLIGNILIYGGVIGSILGLTVFAEMFGLPFRAENEGGLAWNLPILFPAIHIEKFGNIGDLLVLSIVFAGIHMGLGFILGVVNNIHHSKRHAIGKFGWLLILIGLVSMILIIAAGLHNRLSNAVVGLVLYPLKAMVLPFGSISIPIPSVILIFIGIPITIAGEGGVAFIEIFTLISNIFSYGRIAAIGVAEAGVHYGFNEMLLPPMISSFQILDAKSIGMIILLALALVICQLLVFILGTFSAGIQSLRLHFFEFFTKFYEGGGKEFSPFGKRFKYVKEV